MTCEDAPCCGCCGPEADYVSAELAYEWECDMMDYDPMEDYEDDDSNDAEAILAEAQFTEDMACEGYDED